MRWLTCGIAGVLVVLGGAWQSGQAASVLLDADTPATGSLLATTPLSTPYGTITFRGTIRDRDGDPEFNAAGALGNVFNIASSTDDAELTFGFDVSSLTFIYGGNLGVFDAVARDARGVTVASFYQASTDSGQPAGPITLSGTGIRSLYWRDPGWTFAAIDNVEVLASVPEPSTFVLLGMGAAGLLGFAWRRQMTTV